MSWQAYIDISLVASGHVNQGCIFSANGDSVWASSGDLTPSPAEMKSIADILDGKPDAKDKAFSEGVSFAGKKYVMTQVDGRTAYARSRKDAAGNGGKDGLAICKSTQAIIVGHHGEDQAAGNASTAVAALTDYLIGQKF